MQKCHENEGDCDKNDDCQSGLICGQDFNNCGKKWGTEKSYDCCIKPSLDYCSSTSPCKKGFGHCKSHYDCEGDLLCGVKNCGSGWPSGYNCCMNPTVDYCSPTAKCYENEGDCDKNEDCQSGLICGQDFNNCGKKWGPDESYDCCIKPSLDSCSPTSPCKKGFGNCKSHDDCEDDLLCGVNNCGSGWPNGYNCCMKPTVSYCTPTSKCHENEGDCDKHEDCQAGLVCSQQLDNCGKKWGSDKSYDCCMKPSWSYCSPTSPCHENEGDCDKNEDCLGDLICHDYLNNCGNGLGAKGYDCCMKPSK